MFRKLDKYTVKTFAGPFLAVFSVLFFIFIVQFAWQEMEKFAGKGLGWLTIAELLIYLGINVIQLVLPLTILLSAIMTFGGFGERYELAAMKAAGVSLFRIMMPLIIIVCFLSVGLYVFGDRIMPFSQRKARNLITNIANTNPTMQMVEGVFIESIPGYSIKINEISGENQERLKDVFIYKQAVFDENMRSLKTDEQKTILSQSGTLSRDEDNPFFLKLELFDGYIYEDDLAKKSQDKIKQSNRTIRFDTANLYIDIADVIAKAMDGESQSDHYKFLNGKDLAHRNDSMELLLVNHIENTQRSTYNRNIRRAYELEEIKESETSTNPENILQFESLAQAQKNRIIGDALDFVRREKESQSYQTKEIKYRERELAKQKLHYQRNFSYAFTCIVFFLIGAPLGAIVKKGGIGMPVVISIVIFVIYYIINFSFESMNKNGAVNPTLAAWIPNLVFFPFSILLFYKANNDSELFDVSKYLDPIKRIITKFKPLKDKEHSRYQ